jgi:hypothetical protein
MKKITHILKGWLKAFGILSTSTAELKLSQLRLSICTSCQHKKITSVLEIIHNSANMEDVIACGICHCPCLEKSLVTDEQCPIHKW